MSYLKIKSFHVNKKENKIYFTYAENNIRPLMWRKYEEPATDENIKNLIKDLIDGSIQAESSCYNLWQFNNILNYELAKVKKNTNWSSDWDLELNLDGEYKNIFCDLWAIPYFVDCFLNKEYVFINSKEMKENEEKLIVLDIENKKKYDEAREKQKNAKIVLTRAALWSCLFQDYDILIKKDSEELIIAKREKYDNKGHLDNSDDSAVFLGDNTSDLFYVLSDGYNLKNIEIERLKNISSIIFEKDKKLFDQFNVLLKTREAMQ